MALRGFGALRCRLGSTTDIPRRLLIAYMYMHWEVGPVVLNALLAWGRGGSPERAGIKETTPDRISALQTDAGHCPGSFGGSWGWSAVVSLITGGVVYHLL